MNLDTNKELTILTYLLIIIILLIFLYIYINGLARNSWVDRGSKMEHFDYFCGALHLGWLISSGYATVYLTTFDHVVFIGVTVTRTSEMDSFSYYT